ncbi:hypothetical protein B0H34DRAFT_333156 [Crassisporium funariophilum]|nr:hypothetical protein B0H34DRAFT_333156 [Crassisporium funariophilum]
MNRHVGVGALWDATILSYIIFGSTICQAYWYFKAFPKDTSYLKCVVALAMILETIHVGLLFRVLWFYTIQRATGLSKVEAVCPHWSLLAQTVPAEMACFLVDTFSLLKMWKFLENRKWALLASLPYTVGWTSTAVYLFEMYKNRCYPKSSLNGPSLLTASAEIDFTNSSSRRALALRSSKSLRLIHILIVWSLGTGIMMVLFSSAFLVAYLRFRRTLLPSAIFIFRTRVYVSSMLSMLNDRVRYKRIVDETIQLDSYRFDISCAPDSTPDTTGTRVSDSN